LGSIETNSICQYSKVGSIDCLMVLIGNINLKHVNIRPDEANKLIDGLLLPVSLKAGMIGNL
jgi:hypothetical protein